MNDLKQARNEKVTEEHDVIDEAIRDRGDRYTVFSIVCSSSYFHPWRCLLLFQPVGVLYRPAENKLKNIQAKDYLGKAVRYFFVGISLFIDANRVNAEVGGCKRC